MFSEFTYLFINFLTVIFPLSLSFDKRVQFYKKWHYVLPSLLLTGIVFIGWDSLFTIFNVWSFNTEYILGIYFFNLPIEEILFFITVPFSCIFIYECLNYYIQNILKKFTPYISYALLITSIASLVLYYDRIYTATIFFLLFCLVFYAQFIKKVKYLSRFYLAYLISLIPFYFINGILTSLPVVIYNNMENSGFRTSTIPFEDYFYSLVMLLMNIMLYEFFKKLNKNARATTL